VKPLLPVAPDVAGGLRTTGWLNSPFGPSQTHPRSMAFTREAKRSARRGHRARRAHPVWRQKSELRLRCAQATFGLGNVGAFCCGGPRPNHGKTQELPSLLKVLESDGSRLTNVDS
jgi:hypothetical protein